MRSGQITRILCEGETEIALLRALGVVGKHQKLNLWDCDINKFARTWRKGTRVYVVFDTDVTRNTDRFRRNIETLRKSGILKGLLQQTQSLEDELVRACSGLRSRQDLYDHFGGAVSASEFKGHFAACANIAQKLDQVGLDPHLLWAQPSLTGIPDAWCARFADLLRHGGRI